MWYNVFIAGGVLVLIWWLICCFGFWMDWLVIWMLIFDLLLVVVISLLIGVVVFVCGCLIVILLFETWWFG